MGRKTIYWGLIAAGIGFITAVYASSLGNRSHLPGWLVFVLCPAGILEVFIPTAAPDAGFLSLVEIVNAIIYGLMGLTCAMFFRADNN